MKFRKYLKISIALFALSISSCKHTDNQKSIKNTSAIELKSEDIVFGNIDAINTIYIFASYHCNYCRYFFSTTYPELKKNYIDNNKIKLVLKLVEFSDNPKINSALNAAISINKFGTYDKFHELLLFNPNIIFTDEFDELIDDIIANNKEIEEGILNNNYIDYLKTNVDEFRNNKLSGTPVLILNNHAYEGYISIDNLQQVIEKEFKL
nr:thioredoxin domain-containing protein [uncultured Carboxylicivirga sp.]